MIRCTQKSNEALEGGQKGGESIEVKWRWRRTSQSPEFDDYGGSDGELPREIVTAWGHDSSREKRGMVEELGGYL